MITTRTPPPGPSSEEDSSTLVDLRNVKKEDFAETAMNELLGWYGYDKRGSPPPPRVPPQTQSPQNDECAWCNNPITGDANSVTQSMGEKFCSEVCFSQSRRATFKRAKTCDWCRHVRHTVSYVDFQDGATQLQFCSDKCLNQYKMHIFCRETQAHLDLNPHLASSGSSNTNLITPELWLKNCKSRSNSPNSEPSTSPTAERRSTSPSKSPPEKSPSLMSNAPTTSGVKTIPLITVAPTSKLMKAKVPEEKTAEARRDHRMLKSNLKKRRSSRTAQAIQKMSLNNSKPQDLSMSDSSMAHDDPVSSMIKQNIISPPPVINPRLHPPNMTRPYFNFPPPNNLFNMNQDQFHGARFLPPQMFPHPVPPPPPSFQPPNEQFRSMFPFPQGNLGAPPVTVLVPYPIVLPVPFPIPIPLPLTSFLKAYESRLPPRKAECSTTADDCEEPLDFTMNQKDRKESCLNETIEPSNVDECQLSDKETPEVTSPENDLPKFKITKQSKVAKSIANRPKEFAESARPLRKRRRLVENTSEDECHGVLNKNRKTVPV